MADIDLQKEILNISKNKTGFGESIETILATPSDEGWLFRGWQTSSMFELAVGENWHMRVQAEPYRPLWEDALKALEKRKGNEPVLIDLELRYEWIENHRIAIHLKNTVVRDFDPVEEFYAQGKDN